MARVVLVGFPGAGKTTVAKSLSRFLCYDCIDLDQAIEEYYHTSIPLFIHHFGEGVFRQCENKILKDQLQRDNIVLSTGGGTPCFYEAMDLINSCAVSVYIKLSEQSLYTRLVRAKKKRPLLNYYRPEEIPIYIKNTLAEREPVYSKAHVIIKGESIKTRELADNLRELIRDQEISGF